MWNVTLGVSEGTIASDANGVVAEGAFSAPGEVIEISHATYPLTARFTLTLTQAEAYTHPDNGVVAYIAEDLSVGVTAADFAELILTDNNDPGVKPIKIADARPGVYRIPYQSSIAKSLHFSAVTHDITGKTSTRDLSVAEGADVNIPAITAGPRCIFDHFTDAPTLTTSLETLYIDQIDAGLLSVNGDKILAEYSGIFAGNTNEKIIIINFAGTDIFDSTEFGSILENGTHWNLEFTAQRVSNTVMRVSSELLTVGTPFIKYAELTGLNLTTTDYDLLFQAQTPTAVADLTAKMGHGLFIPAAVTGSSGGGWWLDEAGEPWQDEGGDQWED